MYEYVLKYSYSSITISHSQLAGLGTSWSKEIIDKVKHRKERKKNTRYFKSVIMT